MLYHSPLWLVYKDVGCKSEVKAETLLSGSHYPADLYSGISRISGDFLCTNTCFPGCKPGETLGTLGEFALR